MITTDLIRFMIGGFLAGLAGAGIGLGLARWRRPRISPPADPGEAQADTDTLRVLLDVSRTLALAPTVDALCRAAVSLWHSRLGLDRVSLWFLSGGPSTVAGSYGIDEQGQVRDERGQRLTVRPQSLMGRALVAPDGQVLEETSPLYDAMGRLVGQGGHVVTALRSGDQVVGALSVDNLLSGQPISSRRRDVIHLYALTVGHLYALKQSEETLRALSAEVVAAEGRERRRLAVVLHETIGQTLALGKLRLSGVRDQMAPGVDRDECAALVGLLDDCLQETRTLTTALSPPILYELGLVRALEWLADQMRAQNSLAVVITGDVGASDLSDDLRGFLFQAVREALLNVVKHAETTQATVTLSRGDGMLCLVIRDDGVGFDPAQLYSAEPGGFGLFSLRERLRHLGGRLDVSSTPGAGTRVTLCLPEQAMISSGTGGEIAHGDTHPAG